MFLPEWQSYREYSNFPVYSYAGLTSYGKNYYRTNYSLFSDSNYPFNYSKNTYGYFSQRNNTTPQYRFYTASNDSSSYFKKYSFNYDLGYRNTDNYRYSLSKGYERISINSYNLGNQRASGFSPVTPSPISNSGANASRSAAPSGSSRVYYGPSDLPSDVTIDLDWWRAQGYDEEKGNELSLNAFNKPHQGKSGECVGYTRKTINEVYGTTFTNAGAAERFGYKILSSPELEAAGGHFRCFKINGIKPSQVPDGAVLIWPHTAYADKPGSKASLYGHGGIAHGGKVYSNCVCQNLSKCCEIWIPVKA
ncbi:hypothetical protein J6S88_03050 [bacterium]|nr:hypothetical protein [bacterium]